MLTCTVLYMIKIMITVNFNFCFTNTAAYTRSALIRCGVIKNNLKRGRHNFQAGQDRKQASKYRSIFLINH
jgi:hypothetical protein